MQPHDSRLQERFFVAGVNYRTAPVQVRERMAVAHPDRLEVSRLLQLKGGLSEVVVLWTCNRVEIYGVGSRSEPVDIDHLFACLSREAPSLKAHVYCHRGSDAMRHLLRVAGGLDSMVLGETQITGQVRDAYEEARKEKMVGKVLNSVFQKALQTAKAIRNQTTLGRGARSVGGVAVARARKALGNGGLKDHSVLMIGAGEMAACCLLHLKKKGSCSITVANRSIDRARQLAEEHDGRAVPLSEMADAMAEADVVISSTGSSDVVITPEIVKQAMADRPDRALVLIDIAVPRDIDSAVSDIDHVFLHDIDSLQSEVNQTLGRWEKDLKVCEAIISTGIEELFEQFKSRCAAANAYHDAAVAV